jgi:multiple sugar transport system permease protein
MTTTLAPPAAAPAPPAPSPPRRRWRFRPVYLLVLAWLVGVLGPYLWMFVTSITPSSELAQSSSRVVPENPTFSAYADLLSGTAFLTYVRNSLIVAVGTVVLTTGCALLAGTALSRYRFRGRTAVLYGILLVQLFPVILLIVPLYIELKTFGLLDSKLGLVLAYTAFALSFSTWLMKGFIDQIPVEIEEASYIDGCSRFQSFRYVILPLSRPGIAAAGTYAFIYSWNEFLLALTFTASDGSRTIPVGLRQFIGENIIRWEYLTAGGVLAAIPILIGFMYAQKALISGLASGAVKG